MDEAENNLTSKVLAGLWTQAKAKQTPDDAGLAAFQKFMILHEEMHVHWEKLEKDPEEPLLVDGENLLVHIAMDASTMRALETNEPSGISPLYARLIQNGLEQGMAFHVLSQAMQHEFLASATEGHEMELPKFLARAAEYTKQAIERKAGGR
jgi:hypothetical protein